MKITGIICEYNPFHAGHKKQLDAVRDINGSDTGIVCLMSGNFVQRGMPAVFHKMYRAKAAIECGADLVLELPVTAALSSAEGFADQGVAIASGFCDDLCFGAEIANKSQLFATAKALLSEEFSAALRQQLETGCSFPAARQTALEALGLDASALQQPNNILGVEYCKAILAQNSPLTPLPIHRGGSYHDTAPDEDNPSATSLRALIESEDAWHAYVPTEAYNVLTDAPVHALHYAENAILAKLRTMTDTEFQALPYGAEGLWRKLMHACRSERTLEDILTATKSKRYTRTRLDRMVMCAFLGITEKDLRSPAPYVRVLAFNDRGRQILKKARLSGNFPNIGEIQAHPYQALENRCGDLYALFSAIPEAPGAEQALRVFYHA